MVAGFALWNYQYNKAFGVQDGLWQAVKDWWLGGNFTNEFAQKIDPAVAPGVGNSQIFFVFLAVYGGFVCALVHTSASERLRSFPLYAISAVIGGVIYPVVLWLTWGSTSPLTNAGLHDFVGAYSAYIFAGAFGLVLTMKLKPRSGLFPNPGSPATWAPNNVPMALLGVAVLMFAAPLIVMGCGFFVPNDGYYGVSMTTSGLGIVYTNVFVAFAVGGIVGAIIAHVTRTPSTRSWVRSLGTWPTRRVSTSSSLGRRCLSRSSVPWQSWLPTTGSIREVSTTRRLSRSPLPRSWGTSSPA